MTPETAASLASIAGSLRLIASVITAQALFRFVVFAVMATSEKRK